MYCIDCVDIARRSSARGASNHVEMAKISLHTHTAVELMTLHRTTLNRATVKRRQLIGATNNLASLKRSCELHRWFRTPSSA